MLLASHGKKNDFSDFLEQNSPASIAVEEVFLLDETTGLSLMDVLGRVYPTAWKCLLDTPLWQDKLVSRADSYSTSTEAPLDPFIFYLLQPGRLFENDKARRARLALLGDILERMPKETLLELKTPKKHVVYMAEKMNSL
uniref:Uncharacterized protein n=1 Tax=Vitrella brassicaformis TaxID=1169539 RepID=A0A7S1JS72_9ALVE